jgi:hypothetical protein
MVVHACHLRYMGSINRRDVIQAGLGINVRDPIQKIPTAKRAGDVAQMVEHLSGKLQALSSNPISAKKIF